MNATYLNDVADRILETGGAVAHDWLRGVAKCIKRSLAVPSSGIAVPPPSNVQRELYRSGDYHDMQPGQRVVRIYRDGSYLADSKEGQRTRYSFMPTEAVAVPQERAQRDKE